MGVFLDIQGAFDNVSAKAIKQSMEKRGLPKPLIKWYDHYVGNRRLQVDHNGVQITRYLVRGTPQGGVLSPVIWNLVFEDLLETYKTGQIRANGYADDGALVTVGNNPHTLMNRMQLAVNKALNWGKRCDLLFSPEKTVVILFTRKYKAETPKELTMDGKPIPFSNTVKYLGVTLDRKLFWKAHTDQKIKGTKYKLMRVRNAMGKIWGSNSLMMRWLYTNCIRPALSYGALVWAKVCERQWARTALNKVNRLALMMTGHYRRSTPTAGLEVILHVRPLDIHIQYEACLAFNRTNFTVGTDGTFIQHRTIKGGHREYCANLMAQFDLAIEESDRMTPVHVWRKPFTLDTQSFLSGKPGNSDPGTYEIYCDGSGLNDNYGSGVAIYKGPAANANIQDSLSYHLGQEASVFQGEIHAIKAASHWIERQKLMAKTIIIYSDSRAALLALGCYHIKSKLVLDTHRVLTKASEINTVILRWVKAHVGHDGNELADELAKKGTESTTICSDAPKVPESMIKQRFRKSFDNHWQNRWSQRTDCRQTKHWMPTICKRISFEIVSLGRKPISWLIQLLTGHNFMNRHEALVQQTEENECRLCLEDEESTFHIMAECPALARARQEIFGIPFQRIPLQWSVKQVVSFVRETPIDSLLDPANIYGAAE